MATNRIPVALTERLRESFVREDDIIFAYLYGSVVLDPELPGGDIDIAAHLKPSDMQEYVRREKELTDLLVDRFHSDEIDFRILNVLPLVLQHRILRDGILVFSRDELQRVEFETNVMIRFFELKPYLDEYTQMLVRRMRGQ